MAAAVLGLVLTSWSLTHAISVHLSAVIVAIMWSCSCMELQLYGVAAVCSFSCADE